MGTGVEWPGVQESSDEDLEPCRGDGPMENCYKVGGPHLSSGASSLPFLFLDRKYIRSLRDLGRRDALLRFVLPVPFLFISFLGRRAQCIHRTCNLFCQHCTMVSIARYLSTL